MLGSVIEAGKALVGASEALRRLGGERRARLATYFDQIGEVLQGFADATRQGKRSAGPCGELAEYAKAMRDVASPTLPPEEVDRLAPELASACENWRKVTPGGEPGEGDLDQIEAAAAHFRGFANVLRAR